MISKHASEQIQIIVLNRIKDKTSTLKEVMGQAHEPPPETIQMWKAEAFDDIEKIIRAER